MNKETALMNEIRIALSEYGVTFRANVFDGYTKDGRYIKSGLPVGFSDIFGFMNGTGKIFFIEVKTKIGRATKEQLNFIECMKKNGALAGIARSVEEAIEIIKV